MSKPGYRPRVADRQLAERLLGLGAVVIEGVKGCGKTATAREVAASEVLLDVDVSAAQAARVDPRLVLAGPAPRLIDEWQREPRVWTQSGVQSMTAAKRASSSSPARRPRATTSYGTPERAGSRSCG